jgi:hypothetical protein
MTHNPNEVEVVASEDQTFRLTVTDEVGAAEDLTGRTLRFTVREKGAHVDPTALISKTSAVAGEIDIVPPASNGLADVTLVPGDTSSLRPKDYLYDVWLIEGTGEQYNIISSTKFTIKQRITVV